MATGLVSGAGTMNGLDIMLWVCFFLTAPRLYKLILTWPIRSPAKQVQRLRVSQPLTPNTWRRVA